MFFGRRIFNNRRKAKHGPKTTGEPKKTPQLPSRRKKERRDVRQSHRSERGGGGEREREKGREREREREMKSERERVRVSERKRGRVREREREREKE